MALMAFGLLPLPARNEWGEGNPNKNGPHLPGPLLPLWGGEGEFLAASPVPFLNSMAVGIQGEGPCFFHTLRKFLHRVRTSVLISFSPRGAGVGSRTCLHKQDCSPC